MDLTMILASSCRQKILIQLSMQREGLAIMDLAQFSGSTYNEINRNSRILENEGIVIQKYIGHCRIIRLNWENSKTIILLKVIETMIRAMGGALPLCRHGCKTNKKYKIQVNQTDMLLKTKPKKLQNKKC